MKLKTIELKKGSLSVSDNMETSEFTKKCQLATEALNNVLNCLPNGKEITSIENPLFEARDILERLAIPESTFIGRSNMKCLLIEKEDNANSLEIEKEDLNYELRSINVFFDLMDELGITRVNKEVYDFVLDRCVEADDEEKEKLIKFIEANGSDKTAVETFKELLTLKSDCKSIIEEIMEARPDYFEIGKPEQEIECDESCRGTEKVLSREQLGEGVTCITIERPDNCLYKNWL